MVVRDVGEISWQFLGLVAICQWSLSLHLLVFSTVTNPQALAQDLLEGSETERILSKGVDESGRQLLHLASCRGDQEAAADMVRLLLEHGAPVNAADFTGETPLSLAVAAALQTSASDRAWAALDTVRVLLVAGAIDLSPSVLQRLDEANDEEAAELFRLLQAFGIGDFGAAEMPEAEAEAEKISDLDQQCQQESIPLEQLGSLGARAVLASCEHWRQMTVKQLRSECSELGIPTEGCVEKAEVIQTLGGQVCQCSQCSPWINDPTVIIKH